MPAGETHEPGPMANTARQVLGVRMRLIMQSADQHSYMLDPITGTAYNITVLEMTDRVREFLYENKRPVDDIFEMRPLFRVDDGMWMSDGVARVIREISLEYTKLEGWTGAANNQTSLSPFVL
jgi:hypothetical protein